MISRSFMTQETHWGSHEWSLATDEEDIYAMRLGMKDDGSGVESMHQVRYTE